MLTLHKPKVLKLKPLSLIMANTGLTTLGQYPRLDIQYQPVGVPVSLGKVPTRGFGTFLDLFAPNVNAKELQKQYSKELEVKRWRYGNVSNYYMFTALAKLILEELAKQISRSSVGGKDFQIKEGFLAYYFSNYAKTLFRDVKVQKVATGFKIQLPLLKMGFHELLVSILPETQVSSVRYEEDVMEALNTKTLIKVADTAGGYKLLTTKENMARFFGAMNNSKFAIKLGEVANSLIEAKSLKVTAKEIQDFFSNYVLGFIYNFDATKTTELDQSTVFNTFAKDSEIELSCVVHLPKKEASYYIQDDEENINASDILRFVANWYTKAAGASNQYPSYSYRYQRIKQINEPYPRKHRGDANVVILPNNHVIWIPKSEYFNDSYFEEFETAVMNNESGVATFRNDQKVPNRKLIYVDWVNEKLVYTDADSIFHVVNLDTTFPSIPKTVIDLISSRYPDDLKDIGHSLRRVLDCAVKAGLPITVPKFDVNQFIASVRVVDNVVNLRARTADTSFSAGVDVLTSIVEQNSDRASILRRNDAPVWTYSLSSVMDIFEQNIPVLSTFLANCGKEATKLFAEGDDQIIKVINSGAYSPITIMQDLAKVQSFLQVNNFDGIISADRQARANYLNNNPNMDEKIAVSNLPNLQGLMYHQDRIGKKLWNNGKVPEYAILRVSAGGGKTASCLLDIAKLLGEGIVNKPLVLCPNNLIKDYVKEAAFFSKGKLNVIPLDGSVFREYCFIPEDKVNNIPHSWDYSRLKRLLTQAPKNTITVLGYDVISMTTSNQYTQMYGTTAFESYSHLDMLSEIGYDVVYCDESHYLKGNPQSNEDSVRAYVNRKIISRIPYKRLLTGTLGANTLLDFVKQLELFNPAILGSVNEFMRKYGDPEFSGGFRPRVDSTFDAESAIYNLLESHCLFINVERKEWAAFLPEMSEFHVSCEMTENQQKLYKHLINIAVDEIEQTMTKEEKEALLQESVEDDSAEVDNIFDKYSNNLHAVEAFLANPGAISVANNFLVTADDWVSPKGREVNAKLRQYHINDNPEFPGKVLIFCNTHASVEGIYNALDEDIKNQILVYSAEKKAEAEMRFNSDPTIRGMIGVSNSMDTGLNLQVADTLMRVDTVWTPARLEQGNARINRPNMKAVRSGEGDPRMETGIRCYYFTVDGTIDVLKFAKLTSKAVTLARFYNKRDARYQDLGVDPDTGKVIEPIRVSFANLRAGMTQEELREHVQSYQDLRSLEVSINQEFAEEHPEMRQPHEVEHLPDMEGSKFLLRVPYVNGCLVPNMSDLDLIPYLDYRNKWIYENPGKVFNPEGLKIHTEVGDGICQKEVIEKAGKKRRSRKKDNEEIEDNLLEFDEDGALSIPETVTVNITDTDLTTQSVTSVWTILADGTRVIRHPTQVFVINRERVEQMEIRNNLAEITGLDVEDIDLTNFRLERSRRSAETRRKKEAEDQRKREAREAKRALKEAEKKRKEIERQQRKEVDPFEDIDDEDAVSSIDVEVGLINGIPAITINEEVTPALLKVFKKYGPFIATPDYFSLQLKTKSDITKFMDGIWDLWEKGKIEIPQAIAESWAELEEKLGDVHHRSKTLFHTTPKFKADVTKYMRQRVRNINNPKILRVVPYITEHNGVVTIYAIVDVGAHNPALVSLLRRTIRLTASRWKINPSVYRAYLNKPADVKTVINNVAKDWDFDDPESLKREIQLLRYRGKRK